eukprot:gene1419-1919_t
MRYLREACDLARPYLLKGVQLLYKSGGMKHPYVFGLLDAHQALAFSEIWDLDPAPTTYGRGIELLKIAQKVRRSTRQPPLEGLSIIFFASATPGQMKAAHRIQRTWKYCKDIERVKTRRLLLTAACTIQRNMKKYLALKLLGKKKTEHFAVIKIQARQRGNMGRAYYERKRKQAIANKKTNLAKQAQQELIDGLKNSRKAPAVITEED